MNKDLNRLLEIANKSECRIIGLMSGTSLDGLDIALCRVTKKMICQEHFKFIMFPKDILNALKRTRSKKYVLLDEISELHTKMAHFFANGVNRALTEWGIDHEEIDLISSHGQTIYHNSEASTKHTLQIVDGDHIARKTGIITISDFRQKHVSAGGDGAPLAIYFDEFLFQDAQQIRVALNLGGIANLTFIPPKNSQYKLLSTDVGPANTLVNDAMQYYFDKEYDNEGETAAKGKVNNKLLKMLLADPFFKKPFPKSCGQEFFNLGWVHRIMKLYNIDVIPQDIVRTLTELSIEAINLALEEIVGIGYYEFIISGGGCYNKSLLNGLKNRANNARLLPVEDFGVTSDAKEAVLMAFLGFIQLQKKGVLVDNEVVHLGKICLPN